MSLATERVASGRPTGIN